MPSNWKDRAQEVDSGWKSRAIAKDSDQGAVPSQTEDTSIMGGLQQSFNETLENPMDTTMDALQGVHQGVSLGHSDEMASTAAGMYEVATGADYQKAKTTADNMKQKIRNRIDLARERSPIAYYGAELVTPNPLDFIGIGKAGKLARKVPRSARKLADMAEWGGEKATSLLRSGTAQGLVAAHGYGDGEADMTDYAIGGAAGLAGDAARKGLGSLAAKRPRETRQASLGAGATAFRERGRLKRENVDKFLDDFGFYNNKGKRLTLNNDLQAIPSRKSVPKNLRPSELKLENAESLLAKAHERADDALFSVTNKAPIYSAESFLGAPEVEGVIDKISRRSAGDLDTHNALNSALRDITNTFNATGTDGNLSLYDLTNVKRMLQTKGRASMSSAGQDTAASKVYAELQGPVNDMIKSEANKVSAGAGDLIGRANEIQSALITQAQDLVAKVGYEKAAGMKLPFLSKAGLITTGAKEVVSAPFMADTRVALGMFRKDHPIPSNLLRAAVKSAPRKMVQGIQNGGQNDIVGQLNSIPKMLAKRPIPRDSKEILKNKEFVVAKISMAAPQMLPYIKHVLYEEPEKLDDILPMLVEMAPNMFENDVYNRINGKMLNPADREKALKDNAEDETLSNTEKAMRAHSIALKGMV